jgi:hypothetical protein
MAYTIKFRIKGILTHYCQESLVHNLKNVEGIEEVYLDFLSGQGTMLATEEIDREFVTEVIDIMGYTIEWIQ